jgi:transcriptional regulator with XRE-family HTH domain
MKNFGETIRELRLAQDLGLRETAAKVGISPAYLSRIERGKETPPRPEVIKELAKLLAADPDVLFRVASSTDPDVLDFLRQCPEALHLLRVVKDAGLSKAQMEELVRAAEEIKQRQ